MLGTGGRPILPEWEMNIQLRWDGRAFGTAIQRIGRLIPMSKVERWERRAEVPLVLLALAFLCSYAWPIVDPRLDPSWATYLSVVSWTVWVAFGVDLLIRLVLADQRGQYALRHWYDVALIALPMLRPLRMLRLLALIRVLDRSASNSLAERALVYVGGTAGFAVGLGSLAVLDAERGAADANFSRSGTRCGGPRRP